MNQKELLIISITVFFTIIAWVIFDIHEVKKNITIKENSQNLQPINFTLDPNIVSDLTKKNP